MLRGATTACGLVLAVAVLATRVATSVDTTSTPLVSAPLASTAGTVAVTVDLAPPLAATAGSPVAVVWRVTQATPGPARFALVIDGRAVCDRVLTSPSRARIDCQLDRWPAAAPHEVRAFGPGAPWTLESLDLSTVHASIAFGGIVVTPAGSRARVPLSWFEIAAAALLIGACLLIAPYHSSRPSVRFALAALGAIGALTLVALLVAPMVTRFAILVSPGMFARIVALVLCARVVTVARTLWRPAGPAAVAAGVAALVVLIAFHALVDRRLAEAYDGNYSGFLQIGARQFDRNPLFTGRDDVRQTLRLNPTGYDGQYMYAVVFDPFLRAFRDHVSAYRRVVDAPPYRFGRIGYPLLAKVISGDRWRLYPAVMIGILLGSVAAAAWVLAMLARSTGGVAAWGLLIAAIPGFWPSLDAGLPEPMAAACALAGYLCVRRRSWILACALFAISLLVRETGGLFVAAVLVTEALDRRNRRAALLCAGVSLAPAIGWHWYVGHVLSSDFGWQAYYFSPPDLTWPLRGFVDLWGAVRAGTYYPGDPSMSRAAVAYPALLVGGALLAVWYAVRARTPVAAVAVVYALVAVSLNFASIWTHVGNGQRGTYELFMMLALLAVIVPHDRRLAWARGAFWTAASIYVVAGSFDAAAVRHALFAIAW